MGPNRGEIPESEMLPAEPSALDSSQGPETSFGGHPDAFDPEQGAHDGVDLNDQMTPEERAAFEQMKYEQG